MINDPVVRKHKEVDHKSIYFSMAGFSFKLNYTYRDKDFIKGFKGIYKNYLLKIEPDKIDYTFFLITKNDVQLLRKKNKNGFYIKFFEILNKKVFVNLIIYPLYTQIVFRYVLLELLSINNGFLFHASGNIINKEIVLFTGKSGIGKSTVMTSLIDKHKPFVDDMACIRKIDSNFYCFKIPFYGKNESEILNEQPNLIRAIFLLERGSSTKIVKVDKIKVIDKLISQLWAEKNYLAAQTKNMYNFISSFNKLYIFNIGQINKINSVFNYQLEKKLF